MRICHVTPHLPPDQAANALLPLHLGRFAAAAGHEVVYVAHPPAQEDSGLWGVGRGPSGSSPAEARWPADLPGPLVSIPRRTRGRGAWRLALGGVEALRIGRRAGGAIRSADVVHVHSNGLLPETCALLAVRAGRPVVLTLYGTEIWHYRARGAPDLFTRAYRRSSRVTFYSQGLLDRARELGLGRDGMSVTYPAVADEFRPLGEADISRIRSELGADRGPLLVNVKRLHPLGGHLHLVNAMVDVRRAFPTVRLLICGTGPLASELGAQAASLGLGDAVRFLGLVRNRDIARYDGAADLFVLPSLLEACPTVALEALACGRPVVSTDTPGGIELHRLFGEDVRVVPREDPRALAAAIIEQLRAPRPVSAATRDRLEREFRLPAVGARFFDVYTGALGTSPVRR